MSTMSIPTSENLDAMPVNLHVKCKGWGEGAVRLGGDEAARKPLRRAPRRPG